MKTRSLVCNIQPKGFSLLEAMVGVVVTALVISSAATFFIKNQQVTTSQTALSMMRGNLRYATRLIEEDLRAIGAVTQNKSNFKVKQGGVEDAMVGVSASATGTTPLPGTDVLTLWRPVLYSLSTVELPCKEDATTVTITKQTRSGVGLNQSPAVIENGDLLLITNVPTGGNLAEIVTYNGQAPNSNVEFIDLTISGKHPEIPDSAVVMKVEKVVYFVGNSAELTPCLYRKVGSNGTAQMMAEFIEDMQLAWGRSNADTSNQVSGPFTPTLDLSVNPQWLRAVRITLLGRVPAFYESQVGKNAGVGDINYYRPQIEDHAADPVASTRPFHRNVYTEVVFLRNVRPVLQLGG